MKARLTYMPDQVAFYLWITMRETLDDFASFRAHWNDDTKCALLDRCRLDTRQKTSHLSKGQRTVFISTHLISEFEGLIDEFTIVEQGRDVLTLAADEAREQYQTIYARFSSEPVGPSPATADVLASVGGRAVLAWWSAFVNHRMARP